MTPVKSDATQQRRTKSPINVLLTNNLDKAERYATIAQRPEILAALTAQELPTSTVPSLQQDIRDCRRQLAAFLLAGSERQVMTQTEAINRALLIGQLQAIQTAVKRKTLRTGGGEDHAKAYFVGTTLKTMRFASLATAAEAILHQARGESLPGITTEKLSVLEVAIRDWKDANEAQAVAQNAATTAHQAATELGKRILNQRIAIQLAADAAFPHTSDENAPVRTELGLPLNGPFKRA